MQWLGNDCQVNKLAKPKKNKKKENQRAWLMQNMGEKGSFW